MTPERPRPKGLRRVERWLVGLVMSVLAFVLERAVLRSIRKGNTKALATEPTVVTSSGNQIATPD